LRRAPVDLASATVFLDFDGTITPTDTGMHLLDRLGDPAWREVDAAYDRGELGSREVVQRQWDMLPHDADLLRRTAAEVPLDPATGPLIDGLRAAGAEVLVISDGFGFHVLDAMAPFDVPVITNEVEWESGELRFPNLDRCCPCSTCGTCKQAPIKDAKRRGRTAVFVGNGTSDRKAALVADVLFATDALAEWCDDFGVDHIRFETLDEVRLALLG
jgi:2-hydroxy-3-keto-5-methylthiopentenyl-1-phosphate phosphatase